MKKLFVLTVVTLLSGCYQTVDSYDINRAIKFCGGIQNVHRISADSFGTETAKCFSGEFQELK